MVLIVVDQMRADFLERLRPHATGGFNRLINEGAWFTNAAYPYLGTFTCPGHATIGTGRLPARHGIPENEWYDREAKAVVACADDSSVTAVRYFDGQNAEGASGPGNLRAPTLAQVLRREKGARVVSLALKARSAIMLAGPEGDAVTWLSGDLAGWETSTAYTASPVAAVQAYVAANPIDADRGKTWVRRLAETAYSGSDEGAGEAPPSGWTRVFPHVLAGTSSSGAVFRLQWERSPYADAYVGRFAAAMAESFSLGQGDRTDVLAIGFSAPDLIGHGFGPQSHEMQDVLLHLDLTLGHLFEQLDNLVGAGRYVVALSSDHGVATLPEQLHVEGNPGGRIPATQIAELVERAARDAAGEGKYVARVLGNDVYFEPGIYERLESTGALSSILRALERSPGIAAAIPRSLLANASSAADEELREAALSFVPDRSGDILLQTDPGFWIMTSQLATTHGTGHAYDQRVPVVLMGPGIRRGRYDQEATPADVAPTLAALAGTRLPDADGRVLTEALTSAPPR
jgi:predicted AlkP superfamily pyrophosphatase or phosphodiesterase